MLCLDFIYRKVSIMRVIIALSMLPLILEKCSNKC